MSEEDEEQEGDATERLRSELGEKFETETNNIQSIQVTTLPSPLIKEQQFGNAKRVILGSVSCACVCARVRACMHVISKEYFRAAGSIT